MIYKFLVFLILISESTFGQVFLNENNKAFLFVDSIFNKANYMVEILDFEYPKDVEDITSRFQKSVADKKAWFEDYYSKYYKPGEGLPYHENFGITKEEYLKIKTLDKHPPTVIVKDSASVTLIRTPDFISFKAINTGANFFESIRIDLKNKTLIFINDTIPFLNEVNASSISPHGEWQGFAWKEEVSNRDDNYPLDSSFSKRVDIYIGKVKKNNRILFYLKYKENAMGKVKADFEMSCYMH